MDLFGLKNHEEQHEQTEATLRRLVEQVSQLSIYLGQTRTDLSRLYLMVQGKIDEADIDPVLIAANESLGRAREQLSDLEASANEQWNELSAELEAAVAKASDKAPGIPDKD